jgi:Fur family ferric uptake transcriptional regulator
MLEKDTSAHPLSGEWESRLQQAGCRLTAPRQAVIAALMEARNPLSPIEVFDLARRLYGRIGLVTVYRTLDRLENLALIRRVSMPGKGLAYLPTPQDADILLLCKVCGHTEQVSEKALELFLEHIGQKLGYQLSHQPLEITGTCQDCQRTLEISGDMK